MKSIHSTNVSEYVDAIEKLFDRHRSAEHAAGAKAYMRDLFEYYGLGTPKRRMLEKKFHEVHPLPSLEQCESIVRKLWTKPQRELQYFAMELLFRHKKKFTTESIQLFEFMIRNKSWWDTVDFISPKLIAAYFDLFPEMIKPKTNEWISSGHIWLMRTAIIFQNNLKKKTDEKLLFRLILKSKDHPDFFVRKAIGWALRQYARTNPASVKNFVLANKSKLSELSKKEALKHIL